MASKEKKQKTELNTSSSWTCTGLTQVFPRTSIQHFLMTKLGLDLFNTDLLFPAFFSILVKH